MSKAICLHSLLEATLRRLVRMSGKFHRSTGIDNDENAQIDLNQQN